MHQSVMTWLAERAAQFGPMTHWHVLEVGSYDENGSAREIFEHVVKTYLGTDMRAGRGVDMVCNADDELPSIVPGYDLVICTEMLEHDQRPWRSVQNMAWALAPGGHLLLTARGFDEYQGCYGRHDCPGDFWRFNVNSFNVLLRDAGLYPIEIKMDPEVPGVFGHAAK